MSRDEPVGGRRTGAPPDTDGLVESLLKREAGDRGSFAGAVLLVWRSGEVVRHSAYGHAELFDAAGRRLERPRPMALDTVFDLASITKVLATANLVALLDQEGELRPTDAVGRFLPQFAHGDKRDLTVADLLTHSSGLAAWLPFYLYIDSPSEAPAFIAGLPLRNPRGHVREYSDVNFVLLGAVIEAVTGEPLDETFAALVARPLRLDSTRYRPPDSWRNRTAATSLGNEYEERMTVERAFPLPARRTVRELPGWRDGVMVGEVNDGNCHYAFGGVSGHAGLFSTAEDVAAIGAELLAGDVAASWLRADTVNYFTTPKTIPGQGLGWWTNRLDASPRTFGHRGFTGTQLFIDPENELVAVLLTNRVHSALPYADPATFTGPILASVYREQEIAAELRVDPWLP